ncbi:hypothetical protein EDB86DRAFT_641060 [Lactarius hatsudake]|nr:hypothetical protein EDB86DRAFT_641060 [Lactarius hatsudake]
MGHHQRCSPRSKKKKTVHEEERQPVHSLSPSPPALAEETDSEDDFGEDDWDPHAGTKPSPLDGEASDEHWDPEDDMEEVESEAFNARMIQMLSDLQDDDPRDQDWKPKQERKLSTKNEHRKAPSFGPDVAAKSARSQQRPKHRHAMQSQSRLTSFDFTRSKRPQNVETRNTGTSSTQLSPRPVTTAVTIPRVGLLTHACTDTLCSRSTLQRRLTSAAAHLHTTATCLHTATAATCPHAAAIVKPPSDTDTSRWP